MKLRDVLDWLWPTAEPSQLSDRTKVRERRREDLAAATAATCESDIPEETLTNLLARFGQQNAAEEQRLSSVHGRLIAVLATTATGAALTLAIVTYSTSSDTRAQGHGMGFREMVAIAAAYSAINFFRAGLSAISGLNRRDFRHALPLLPATVTSSQRQSISSQIKVQLECFHENQEAINRVVTELAVACAAVRNAIIGLVIATIIVVARTIFNMI